MLVCFRFGYGQLVKVNFSLFAFFFQKLFVVPAFTQAQKNIPFSRVNHNKYMVTDKTAYIGNAVKLTHAFEV